MTIQVDESNFIKEVLEYKGLVLAEFYAVFCAPCRAMGPILNSLSDVVKVVKINISKAPEVASHYNICGVPTILFFKDGETVETLAGAQSKEKLLEIIEQNQ